MQTRFDPTLVALSVFVAILASNVALNLANSVTVAKGRARMLWLTCGATAMGVGIWSMHFVGMLAFEMPGMAMAYDVPLLVLSIVVAVVASAVALFVVSRPEVSSAAIGLGGVAMATAIAGMHYIGMYSMRMHARIQWDYFWVAVSIVIALIASFAALFISFRVRQKFDSLVQIGLASVVMGIAIAGMHYTGMIAATFVHDDAAFAEGSVLLVSDGLSITVIAMTLLVLGIALLSSTGSRLLAKRKKSADEALSKSEERFRALVETVKDYAIFMLNPDGQIATWNSGAARIMGYSATEAIGQHFSIFSTEEDRITHFPELELKVAREKGHFETEGLRVRKDGSTFWANIVISPLLNRDGELTGFSKVTRDITQLKTAEAQMRRLNEELESHVAARTHEVRQREIQLRTLTNALPVLVAQLDTEERFLFANDAFCQWFGRSNEQVVGSTFREVLGDKRYFEGNKPFIDKALSGELTTYERVSSNGRITVVFNVTFVPEFVDGKVVGFVLVGTDISRYKEIEKELKQAKEAAEVANKTKSAFLANMSHEIRTPLGAILGFSELLLDPKSSEADRKNSVEIIKRNGRLLSNIINDILDLSKVEAGKLEVEKVNIPFSELLAEVNSLYTLEAAEKGINLSVSAAGNFPRTIQTDPLRLRQILLNIVGNAVKFTEKGSVRIHVAWRAESGQKPKLAFEIKDTGPGIDPRQTIKLFAPFAQADISTTRKFGGTGLGLVLSKKLANALGGDVMLLESALGHGSTFLVTIDPGEHRAEDFMAEFSHPQVRAPAPSEMTGRLKDRKILVVDDSADNQILVSRILSKAGAAVDTAENGREAVKKALGGDFDVVLMDLQMPEMDGYQATKELRSRGYKKSIIALTAHAMKEERRRCLESGFDDHLTKPIDRESLLHTLTVGQPVLAGLSSESGGEKSDG